MNNVRILSEISKLLNNTLVSSRASVSLCFAQTLNGMMHMDNGPSCEESLKITHFLRANHDSILVGINTLIQDDCSLTTRLVPGSDPRPVVLDSNLRIPLTSKLSHAPNTVIFTHEYNDSNKEKEQILLDRGIELIHAPRGKTGLIDLHYVTRQLKERGMKNVMVEGGATVLNNFAEENLVENCFLTIAPYFVEESRIRVRDMKLNLNKNRSFNVAEDILLMYSKYYENRPKYVEAPMPTRHGELVMRKYASGEVCMFPKHLIHKNKAEYIPVRVHSSCITSEVFGSIRCDCAWQLEEALRYVHNEGGVVVYLTQEGRGIGLSDKLRAYAIQDTGLDTVEANIALGHEVDYRNFDSCAQILREDFEIDNICLLSNNPEKIAWAQANFVNVKSERLYPPADILENTKMGKYLDTKHEKLAHLTPSENYNGWVLHKADQKKSSEQALSL